MEKRTVIVTGAGHGIGHAMACKFASMGNNVVIVSKEKPEEIAGEVLVCDADVTDVEALQKVVSQTVNRFGGVDILINNTSAPHFKDVFHTSPEQFDLVHSTSVRAAFFLSQACYPYLKKGKNPHIINIAPPLNLEAEWLQGYLPFALGKLGMSLCTRGLAASFEDIGVNSLWPQTNIATQRLKDHLLPEVYAGSRWPTIMADAAYLLSSLQVTGQCFIDEALLREAGVTDFSSYAVQPGNPLVQTLFLPLEKGMIPLSNKLFR